MQQQRGGACPAVGRDPVAAGSGVSNSNGRREEEGRGKKEREERERGGGTTGKVGSAGDMVVRVCLQAQARIQNPMTALLHPVHALTSATASCASSCFFSASNRAFASAHSTRCTREGGKHLPNTHAHTSTHTRTQANKQKGKG